MTDIRTSSLQTPVDVAQYLFTRLHQIGVRSIHGVPGDYNLVALDYIDKAGLKWVGNVNELNAGKIPCVTHGPHVLTPWYRLRCGWIR
jgi:pyruvate decarboxylase